MGACWLNPTWNGHSCCGFAPLNGDQTIILSWATTGHHRPLGLWLVVPSSGKPYFNPADPAEGADHPGGAGPHATRRADGKWEVTVPVEARKFYADAQGAEKETMLSDRIEIGLFTAEPGSGAFDRRHVVAMQRRPIGSGRQVLRFVVDRKPAFAGIDPYNFYVDRNSADNLAPVQIR